jgi:mRNA interferase MazF
MKRGDLVQCDFGNPIGHEPGFKHPALVLSAEEINKHGIVILAPITKTRRNYPTHVELDGPLPIVCYVQCELIRAVSTDRVIKTVGHADEIIMHKVAVILRRIMQL